MTDEARGGAGRSAGLVALLDLLERPAAAIAEGGVILGANARFGALAGDLGVASPSSIGELLDGAAARAIDGALAGEAAPARATLRDGRAASLRWQTVPEPGGPSFGLLILDVEGAEAPSRACSTLRHELAGPLTAILGTAEMLLVQRPDLPRDVRDRLGEILDNCGRISDIITRNRRPADG